MTFENNRTRTRSAAICPDSDAALNEPASQARKKSFVIIHYFASKPILRLLLGVPGLKRVGLLTAALAFLGALLSCGYSAPSSSSSTSSGIKFRAFVTQAISSSTAAPGLDIVDATHDLLARAPGVSINGTPGMMEVSGNKAVTLVFDSTTNAVTVVNNKQETAIGRIVLPSWTQSMAITPDATAAYIAVPNAPVASQPSGAVEMVSVGSLDVINTFPITSAHYIVLSPDSTHLLVFSDNSDSATLMNFQNTGSASAPNWVVNGTPITVGGFNRPVWATFSTDSNTAYVMNCATECGANAGPANVSTLDIATGTITQTLPLPAGGATHGVLFGNTLYVAGNPPQPNPSPCSTTTSNTCGMLSVITVNNGTLQLATSVPIPDGDHRRMAVTADNQVFIGSTGCTTVNISGNPPTTFGCLAVYNPKNAQSAIIGTDTGDVTGIAPVTGRTEVYVVQNGELRIWDTVQDALRPGQNQIDIHGQAVDVKIAD